MGLGIVKEDGEEEEEEEEEVIPVEKKVQMTLASLQLLFSLSYTPLPRFSLLKRTPQLDTADISGLLGDRMW